MFVCALKGYIDTAAKPTAAEHSVEKYGCVFEQCLGCVKAGHRSTFLVHLYCG